MLEQDYLIRLLMQFFQAMARSWATSQERDDPEGAADMLEIAIGNATDMDGAALLSLAPESIAQIMRATDVDPNVTQFVARSMLLESVYLSQAGQHGLAALRAAQARAIAAEYAFGLPDDPSDFATISEGLEQAALEGGFYADDPQPQPQATFGIPGAASIPVPVTETETSGEYWMQYGSVLDEEDEQPTGFGSFIDAEEV